MKEITRISLAALPYNIEVGAKKELEKYLHAVKVALGADEEAMKEIEARIAELLADRHVVGEKVITVSDAMAIMAQLGNPKEFIEDPALRSASDETDEPEKRLMRDPYNQMIGGVCSGLAAYLHVDPVWVRLGVFGITLMSGGFMILIYLVMWVIMPEARTAADRLQMRGKAVTLSSIQEESSVVAEKSKRDAAAVKLLRIIVGVGLLLMACAALIAVVGMMYHVNVDPNAQLGTDKERWYFWLLVGAGIAFVMFCCVLATMMFMARFSRRFWVLLGANIIIGLTLFATGIFGFATVRQLESDAYTKSLVHVRKSLDTQVLSTTKRLAVDSSLPITVNYNVDPAAREVTFWYNAPKKSQMPLPSLTTNNDGMLTVSIPDEGSTCLPDVTRCRAQYTLTIVGPMLEEVTTSNSSLVHYTVDSQGSLTVSARGDGHIELQSSGMITALTANLGNESQIDMLQAGISTVNLNVQDALSSADIATVGTLAITAPGACAANHGGGVIRVGHAGSVTVNGVAFDEQQHYPCTTIDRQE